MRHLALVLCVMRRGADTSCQRTEQGVHSSTPAHAAAVPGPHSLLHDKPGLAHLSSASVAHSFNEPAAAPAHHLQLIQII